MLYGSHIILECMQVVLFFGMDINTLFLFFVALRSIYIFYGAPILMLQTMHLDRLVIFIIRLIIN